LVGRELAEDGHHAVAEVGIELVIARQRDDAVLLGQGLHLEPRGAHGNAKGFDLRTTRDDTTIIV